MTPLYILAVVNIIKFIKSMSIEYVIKDGFLIINNKRDSSIKELTISDIKYIKHYFTYTKSAERSYGYSKLIKVFTDNETIEVYDTIRNSYDKILPEVLEKGFGVKILHVHDSKLTIFIILAFLLSVLLT